MFAPSDPFLPSDDPEAITFPDTVEQCQAPVIFEGPNWCHTADGNVFRDGKWSGKFDTPLDPDSENEFEGEEQDEQDVWRNAVWRNRYEFEFGDWRNSIRRLPSNAERAAAAAAAAGAAMPTAAAVAAAATTGGQVHTSSTSHHPYAIPHKHFASVCLTCDSQAPPSSRQSHTAVTASPADPALPGWFVETRSNAARTWKIYRGPNGERETTRASALRVAARNVAPQQHMSFTGRATYGNAGPGQWQWHPPSYM